MNKIPCENCITLPVCFINQKTTFDFYVLICSLENRCPILGSYFDNSSEYSYLEGSLMDTEMNGLKMKKRRIEVIKFFQKLGGYGSDLYSL
jgi:hypothetical protein